MKLEFKNIKDAKFPDVAEENSSELTLEMDVTNSEELTRARKNKSLDPIEIHSTPWRDVAFLLNTLLVEMANHFEDNLLSREASINDLTDRYHEHEGEATAMFLMHLRALALSRTHDPEPFASELRHALELFDYIHHHNRNE